MEAVVTNEVQSLVNFVKGEAQYLCCFSSYAATFNQKKEELEAKLNDVDIKIKNARGVYRVKEEARQWTNVARSLIGFDTRKDKCFMDLCPNFWRQYRKGKDLEENTRQIDELLGKYPSDIVAGAADLPGIKYHSLQKFMHFESRKSTFQDLKKALEDENYNMIGLHGLGGTGKTSMAIEVGAELEGSKFDKVIFLVVSKPPDLKKIRHDLMNHLDLALKEGKEEVLSQTIWSKISNMKEKLLIILDDVWEELDLIQGLGIPSSHQHKGCSVLITTRNLQVCASMGCQETIQIQTLNHTDGLNLFLAHASIEDSSHGLKGMTEKLVKQCGGVPVAIVAIARALKNRPLIVWEDALKTLKKHDVNQRLTEAYYKCLKLSYDNLENEKAKEIFFISSLFPEDFEISLQILSKIAIGLGIFGEVDSYYSVRSKVLEAIIDLIDSSLLLTANKQCVKMHDLVREVALRIGEKDIQWIMDVKTPIKENLRYLVWKNHGFPNEFDRKKLEILMIFLGCSKDLNVPDTFFVEMVRLKVLYLASDDEQISAPTLLDSLQSLKDVRTLNLLNLKLGDISLLGNLPRLESLWLFHCSIIELPKEILTLKKLRLLEVDKCKIEKNNPFEVIERCSQLEELSFVENGFDEEKACVVSENLSPPTLQRYKISSSYIPRNLLEKYGSISRWFYPDDLRHLISEATFKQFVRMAEVLILGYYVETRWKNVIPDIVPMEEGGMNDSIVLHLSSWPNIQCLIDCKKYETNVTAFSKLVELQLDSMDVEDLYQGSLPSGFLEQLEIMNLSQCKKLRNILFDGRLSLCHLKAMKLFYCPKLISIFQSFTAQSLMQLEELRIGKCDSLEHIIIYKNSGGEIMGDDNDEKSYELLFPKLKTLQIVECGKLKKVLPIRFGGGLASLEEIKIRDCEQLKYIFDKFQKEDHVMLPSLKEMELSKVPSFISIFREHQEPMSLLVPRPSPLVSRTKTPATFSRAQMCCFWHKSSEETNVIVCKDGVPDHTAQQGSLASKIWFDNSEIITRQLFNVRYIKKLELDKMPLNSESLFTLSMASLILWEELTIKECDELKYFLTLEADDYNNDQMIMSYHSVFSKLEKLEIWKCKNLEFLFPSTISIGLENLKSLTVHNAPEFKYVVGKYHHLDHSSNQNHNVELHFNLPALVSLHLLYVPNFISICAMNYYLAWPSLQAVTLENHNIESFTDDLVVCLEGQLNKKPIKELDAPANVMPPIQATSCLSIQSLNNIKEITLFKFSNLKISLTLQMATMIMWEKLTIRRCEQLEYIVADEGDVGALIGNHRSIFPKLKSLTIKESSKLKYVFGASYHENQNIQTYINFPALERLGFYDLPKLLNICPKNYYLRGLPLKFFYLKETPEFNITSFTDFMVCALGGQRYSTSVEAMEMRLQSLDVVSFCECKIEEVFNLTHMDTDKNREGHEPLPSTLQRLFLEGLSELKSICVGPKYILSLNNISHLFITGCNKLKVIFSDSILKSLPKLWWLKLSTCEELTHIIEEDAHDDDHLCHEPCFPLLFRLTVEHCNKLKYLFSIRVSGILPNLTHLNIEESSNLEHVLIRQDETKKMVMMDVLPKISDLSLDKLSSLISICNEVDFQPLEEYSGVHDCPRFSFYETTTAHVQVDPTFIKSQFQVETKEKLSSHVDMEEVKEKRGLEAQQSSTISPKTNEEAGYSDITKDLNSDTIETTNQLTGSGPMNTMPTTHGSFSQDTSSKKVPVPISSNLNVLSVGGITNKTIESFEEEEEEERGLITTRRKRSGMKAKGSSLEKKDETFHHGDPSMPLVATSPKQTPSSTPSKSIYGRNIHDKVETTKQCLHEAVDTIQDSRIAPSIHDTNNDLSVPGMQEIVDMMKLEGDEPSILEKAFKTNPKLCLSSEDRSTELLCYSYRVLLNILNILATRTPFTITEADKRLLATNLKDASLLGFDKDWLESLRIKVFNYDVYEVQSIQQVIKDLGNKLQANKVELAIVQEQETKAARLVKMAQKELEATHKELETTYKRLEAAQSHFNVAQQEHENIRVRQSQLLEECQEISEQRCQSSEIIAAKSRPFSF